MDYDAMEAGRGLDALIAENIFGWRWMMHHPEQDSLMHGRRFLMSPDQKPTVGGKVWAIPASTELPMMNLIAWDGPHYSTDMNAARQVEEAIDRLGLMRPYLLALGRHIPSFDGTPREVPYGGLVFDNVGITELWWMVHATPEQRCRAALTAIAGRHQEERAAPLGLPSATPTVAA